MVPDKVRNVIGGLEQSQCYLPRDVPNGRRERRRVWAVRVDGRRQRDRCVYDHAGKARGEDDVCNRVVDTEEGNDEARQKQEDRYVEERRDGLHGDGETEAGDALCKEGADEGTLVDRQMGLCELEVAPSPALLECREQSAKQAYDEAQEPEHVDPHRRSRRVPASCRLEEGRARRVAGKGPVRETVELL
jgi:hypothetical protein